MRILIKDKYMLFPVNSRAASKKVCFFDGGELVFDLDCRIDNLYPFFTAYVDVSPFLGKELDIKISPELPYTPAFASEMDLPQLWHEPLRPEVHFTVKNGWNNDPNGLVYRDGVYHMFYQYNPAAPVWGNMHWGHAVSRDLLHWVEKDIALFPDKMGTMFSGSAIIDEKNAAGFGKGAMLLYYTAAGGTSRLSAGQKFTQCLAFSNDGEHFTKYAHNPVVPHIEGGNRDPKVIYVPEIDKYVMAIFRAENRYELLTSADLVKWEMLQELTLTGDAECPDIFRLECEGEYYYVLIGAHDVYVVGHFEDDRFVVDSAEKKLTHLKMSYAAQSFSDTGERVVRIAWHIMNAPARRFASQMSLPTEMRLERINGELYLCALPIKEIEALYESGDILRDIRLSDSFIAETGAHALDISVNMPYTAGEKLVMNVFGNDIALDMGANEIRCKNVKMPLAVNADRVDVRIIVDRCTVEIFADGGKIFAAAVAYADYNLPRVTLNKNEALKIDCLEWHALKNIHGI